MEESLEERAALYALDLLEGAELAAFERELVGNSELRAIVDGYREGAAQLAHTTAQENPPPELRARLLREIGATVATRPPAEIIAFPTWIPWSVAAGFAITTLWLGTLYWGAQNRDRLHRQEADLAQTSLRLAENQREAERIVSRGQLAALERQNGQTAEAVAAAQARVADANRALATAQDQISLLGQRLKSEGDLAQLKIATLASMLGNSPKALAVAVWNPTQQEGVFSVEKMPASADDQDYELWVFDGSKPKPVAAGLFAVGADGNARVPIHPASPITAAAKFAVSRERKGGAPPDSGPQGQVMLIGP